MKRLAALLLTALLLFGLTACAHKNKNDVSGMGPMRVAVITDFGEVTDQGYNQITYESCKEYCAEHDCVLRYFKPVGNADEERVSMIETAIDQGFNVIVMPSFSFGEPIKETAAYYPDVKFIGIDVGESELGSDYKLPSNTVCVIYQEEQCGFMAGYAAVRMGYRKLGYLGGMSGATVKRFGYGFVQGAEQAARELELNDVELKYAYGNQFYGDSDITSAMDTWYSGGTEIVFSCGGSIYTSVAEAAVKANGKLIGVDVDCAELIDTTYGKKITVTSAVKGLRETVDYLLELIADEEFGEVSGRIIRLGVIGDDPEKNYVGLAKTTVFCDSFTKDDYHELVRKISAKELQPSGDVSGEPEDFADVICVENLGSLK